ncbi:unnamed protein product [Clonostachys rosea]|uniref:CBM20 domain-containing protein n=1 Tax=Bionectria ochroleuca TaxID=29856 RepID=A0ABY6U855_BIOOC|nr:unnamed protein product [Clonostachys rosea]
MWMQTTGLFALATAILALICPVLASLEKAQATESIRLAFSRDVGCVTTTGYMFINAVTRPQLGQWDVNRPATCFALEDQMPTVSKLRTKSLKATYLGWRRETGRRGVCHFYAELGCKGKSHRLDVFDQGWGNICHRVKIKGPHRKTLKSAFCYVL